jgi:hypothetical protein
MTDRMAFPNVEENDNILFSQSRATWLYTIFFAMRFEMWRKITTLYLYNVSIAIL